MPVGSLLCMCLSFEALRRIWGGFFMYGFNMGMMWKLNAVLNVHGNQILLPNETIKIVSAKNQKKSL